MSYIADRIDIYVTSRQALEQQLEAAVSSLREHAMIDRARGILVTRITPGHYTAVLSDEVAYGMTHEIAL
jgi:AmiR/NasT family two-component response regulator